MWYNSDFKDKSNIKLKKWHMIDIMTHDRQQAFIMGLIYGSNRRLDAYKWLMLNWIVRNRIVWSFNCV